MLSLPGKEEVGVILFAKEIGRCFSYFWLLICYKDIKIIVCVKEKHSS
jgi:hypothetical protein